MAFFRYFVILRGVFRYFVFSRGVFRYFVITRCVISLFRLFAWRYFVISLICVALFCGKKTKRRNGTNQPPHDWGKNGRPESIGLQASNLMIPKHTTGFSERCLFQSHLVDVLFAPRNLSFKLFITKTSLRRQSSTC